MRKTIGVLILTALFFGFGSGLAARPAFSAEDGPETVFKDGFYGGLAGALVGGAFLAFTKKPGDHLNYIAYGAAAGVIAGTTFGVLKVTRSLAEVDRGEVAFHIPTPWITASSFDGKHRDLRASVDLLKIRF